MAILFSYSLVLVRVSRTVCTCLIVQVALSFRCISLLFVLSCCTLAGCS